MDNLKKNLHLVVFGAGVLVGIICVGVAFMWRGGTETALNDAKAKLSGKAGRVDSKGTLDKAEARSAKFGQSVEDAENALKGTGKSFSTNYAKRDTGLEFFSEEANLGLKRLEARFEAMEKDSPMPELLAGWKITKMGADRETLWSGLGGEMANPPKEKINEMQMRLRILHELAATCEKLVEAGADKGYGVKLTSIKFDAYAPIGTSDSDAPWMGMGFQVQLESSPGFVALLTDELVRPTKLTTEPTMKTEVSEGGHQRVAFPMFIEMLQVEMTPRPIDVRFDIENAAKGAVARKMNEKGAGIAIPEDPKTLDPNEFEGKKLVDAVKEELNEKDKAALPVLAAFKVKAASFNTNWKAVKEDEQNQ